MSCSTRSIWIVTRPWSKIIIRIFIFCVHFFSPFHFFRRPIGGFTINSNIFHYFRNTLRIISRRVSLLPNYVTNKAVLTKDCITNQFQTRLLIVII